MCLPSPHIVCFLVSQGVSKFRNWREIVEKFLSHSIHFVHSFVTRCKKKKKNSPPLFFFTITDNKSTRLLLVAWRKLLSKTVQNNSNKRKYLGSITNSKKKKKNERFFTRFIGKRKKDHTFSSADSYIRAQKTSHQMCFMNPNERKMCLQKKKKIQSQHHTLA